MRYSKGQITVEARLSGPRLSGFLEYPDLHLWLQFSWILITISHILCPELNFFPSNYVIELQCELNLFHFKAQMWVYFTLTRTTTNMFQFSELWLATICSIAEWNFTYSPLSYSVLLLAHSNSFFFFFSYPDSQLSRPFSSWVRRIKVWLSLPAGSLRDFGPSLSDSLLAG